MISTNGVVVLQGYRETRYHGGKRKRKREGDLGCEGFVGVLLCGERAVGVAWLSFRCPHVLRWLGGIDGRGGLDFEAVMDGSRLSLIKPDNEFA